MYESGESDGVTQSEKGCSDLGIEEVGGDASRAPVENFEILLSTVEHLERVGIEEDLLDFAVPMAYTLDPRIYRYQVEAFTSPGLGPRTWIGIGAWLFAKRPAGALEQVAIAQDAGAAGIVLFSWDSIADAPALRSALAEQVLESADDD